MEYSPNSDPTYFGYKSCVWQGKPKLMLCTKFEVATSMATEISRGSHFLYAPLAQTPTSFGPESCFW